MEMENLALLCQNAPKTIRKNNVMTKEIIRVENLKRNYIVGDETVHALRGIDFSISEGEFVTIMGTSGSGKSTLLRSINGLETIDEGLIVVEGKDHFGATASIGFNVTVQNTNDAPEVGTPLSDLRALEDSAPQALLPWPPPSGLFWALFVTICKIVLYNKIYSIS